MAVSHTLIAGAIASTVPNQPLGLALSFVSHPLLDMIPHWDLGWGWRQKPKLRLLIECSLDLFGGLAITYLAFGNKVNLGYFLGCIALSVGWDVLEVPYWFLKWNFPPFSTVYNIQHPIQGKAKLPWGILSQVLSVAFITILLSFLKISF